MQDAEAGFLRRGGDQRVGEDDAPRTARSRTSLAGLVPIATLIERNTRLLTLPAFREAAATADES